MDDTMFFDSFKQSRSFLNSAINIAASLVQLATAVISVGIYIRTIGQERFGALQAVLLVFGYFGFLDLGLSRAITNSLAKSSNLNLSHRGSLIITVSAINIFFGAIGGIIIFFSVDHIVGLVLNTSTEIRMEVSNLGLWLALLFPASLLSGIATGILDSKGRFALANTYQIFASLSGQIVPALCALLFTHRLDIILPVALLARLICLLSTIYLVFRQETFLSARIDRSAFKGLLSYGGWVTLSSLVIPIITSAEQLIISSRLGVAALPAYSVPMSLLVKIQIVPTAIARALFPDMSRLDSFAARNQTVAATRLLVYVSSIICGCALLVFPSFLKIWLGAELASTSQPALQIIILGAWVNNLAFLPFSLLQALGRPKEVALFQICELPIYVSSAYLVSTIFGVAGVAVIWTIRASVETLFMMVRSGVFVRVHRVLSINLLVLSSLIAAQLSLSTTISTSLIALWLFAYIPIALALDQDFKQIVLRRPQFNPKTPS